MPLYTVKPGKLALDPLYVIILENPYPLDMQSAEMTSTNYSSAADCQPVIEYRS